MLVFLLTIFVFSVIGKFLRDIKYPQTIFQKYRKYQLRFIIDPINYSDSFEKLRSGSLTIQVSLQLIHRPSQIHIIVYVRNIVSSAKLNLRTFLYVALKSLLIFFTFLYYQVDFSLDGVSACVWDFIFSLNSSAVVSEIK